jgi:hypothetical protein
LAILAIGFAFVGACIDVMVTAALAQLGERLLCMHQVIGSIPIGSTIPSIFPEMKRNGLPAKGW